MSPSHSSRSTCYNHRFTYKDKAFNISFTCTSNEERSSSKRQDQIASSQPTSAFIPTSSLLEEACDKLRVMMKQETAVYFKPSQHGHKATGPWRRLMIQWMCTIVDVFDLSNQIVSVAVHYLDTAGAKGLVRSPGDYKLAALTALQLAIKVYDYKLFPLQQLLSISHTDITVQQVTDMEQRMIAAMNWMLHPPTFDCFVHEFCSILKECEGPTCSTRITQIEQIAQALSRNTIVDDSFCNIRPSVIAFAATILVMNRNLDGSQMKNTRLFTRELGRFADLTILSQGFLEAINALQIHLNDESSLAYQSLYYYSKEIKTHTFGKTSERLNGSTPSFYTNNEIHTTISSPCNVSEVP